MNFSSSKDESLLSLWESVRRQVSADRAGGGRSRSVGGNLRAYAEAIRSEMDRRELKYTPISWSGVAREELTRRPGPSDVLSRDGLDKGS
ncbi:hypothetical protein Q3C01_44150, partial [Bradyrhizobium sp. UFLA05-109]